MGINLTEKYNHNDYKDNVNKVFLESEWSYYRYFSIRTTIKSGAKCSVFSVIRDILSKSKGLDIDIFTKSNVDCLRKDFEEVYTDIGVRNISKMFNKHFECYNVNNNTISFLGKNSDYDLNKRNISIVIGADLFTKEELNDIAVRTSVSLIIISCGANEDVYKDLEERGNCAIFNSSYKTNIWLSEQQKIEIENIVNNNPIKWGYMNIKDL